MNTESPDGAFTTALPLSDADLLAAVSSARAHRRIHLSNVQVRYSDLARLLEVMPHFQRGSVVREIAFERVLFIDDIEFLDLHVLGRLTLEGCRFEADALIADCSIGGSVLIRETEFASNLTIIDTTFRADVNLTGNAFRADFAATQSKFQGDLLFSRPGDQVEMSTPLGNRRAREAADRTWASSEFHGGVDLSDSQVAGLLGMRRVRFREAASFTGCRFGTSDWVDAIFDGRTKFHGASFDGDAAFIGARFTESEFRAPSSASFFDRSPLSFNGSSFNAELHFSAVCSGHVDFKGCRFRADAAFTDTQFTSGAQFNRSVFQSHPGFHMVSFEPGVDFANVEFQKGVTFSQVTFGQNTRFAGAVLSGETSFKWAKFGGSVSFERAILTGELDASLSTWDEQPSFKEAIIECTRFDARQATFSKYLDVSITSPEVDFSKARLEGGGQIRLGARSQLSLEDCVISAPLFLGSTESGARTPKVLSLRRAHVGQVTVEGLALDQCLFSGASNLDKLVVGGAARLADPPRRHGIRGILSRMRFTGREVLLEEAMLRSRLDDRRSQAWRHTLPPIPGWIDQSAALDADKVSDIYRSLRKGREDAKNQPGAGDLYYGEMETRRIASPSRAERTILWFYWAAAGYGLRASRAFTLLGVFMILSAIGYAGFGLESTTPPSYKIDGTLPHLIISRIDHDPGARPGFTSQLAAGARFSVENSASLFRPPDDKLTPSGEVLSITNRVVAPLLLGLGLISLRGRVKR